MIVPDAVVYGNLALGGTVLVWAARQFIYQTVGNEGNQGNRGPQGDKGDPGEPSCNMSVKEFNVFCDLLMVRLNGRYLLAEDAKDMFKGIENKIDNLRCSQNCEHFKNISG